MPELPEVELTRRRLELDLAGKKIERVEIRTVKLRLPIPVELKAILPGRTSYFETFAIGFFAMLGLTVWLLIPKSK